MNIQDIVKILTSAGIDINEAEAEVKMMIQDICGWTPLDILRGRTFDENKLDEMKQIAQERAQTRKPIQQLLGRAYFYGNYYKITPDVFIPRDETELLAKYALDIINKNGLKSILDIGTGSGCIACSIALNSNAYILGTDISSSALRIALENSSNLNLNNKAVFRKSDIFSKIHKDEKFDMIISNPPYIPLGTAVQKEVEFDPPCALFAHDKDGLEFYYKITGGAVKFLQSNGYLLFECGINQAKNIKRLMAENHFGNIEIIKDFAGIERVVIGQLLS